ncbi:hypothetical protein [Lacinutrix cladophorae]
MKNGIKLFFLVTLFLVQFSCKNASAPLIGAWLRHDFKADSEYTVTFEENNTGFIVDQKKTETGIISNIVSIDWNVKNDSLTISQDGKNIVTTFEFTPEGNLILANFSGFEFVKQ